MKILFDQGTPVPLRHFLSAHEVSTAYEMGWSTLANGELLNAAETEGFEVFVSTDTNLRHQQNLQNRSIAIVILKAASWPRIESNVRRVVGTIEQAIELDYVEVSLD